MQHLRLSGALALVASLALALTVSLAASHVVAGQFNQVLNIGDAAPAWTKLPGTDGQKHSLDDLKAHKVVVVIFTCNSCPIATDYEDRIVAFATKHASDLAVVAINVNLVPEDSLPKMKRRAEQKKFPFPYLFDASQKIAKAYGATTTPEFFVLDSHRKIAFMGGMDDNSNASAVTENFLEPAVEAILKGSKPAKTEAPTRGCGIRFARPRRTRQPVESSTK